MPILCSQPLGKIGVRQFGSLPASQSSTTLTIILYLPKARLDACFHSAEIQTDVLPSSAPPPPHPMDDDVIRLGKPDLGKVQLGMVSDEFRDVLSARGTFVALAHNQRSVRVARSMSSAGNICFGHSSESHR